MLGAIAVLPVIARHWWERRYPLVTLLIALPILLGYLFFARQPGRVLHVLLEYFSFISLIGALYVIAGGIRLRVVGPPGPLFNTLYLFAGAVAANIVGTTGASMLLLRSFLNNNRHRYQPYLIVFFIFIVANIGGALTPVGDPPLLLGYVNGVPFFWVLARVWYIWLIALVLVLAVFCWFDVRNPARRPASNQRVAVSIQGYRSLVLLGIVLIGVFARTPVRELVMLGAAAASWLFTPPAIRRRNEFSFRPIVEVAVLFVGVFVTMAPVLDLLQARAQQFGSSPAGGFFWLTGLFSAILDNAPAYRTFLELAVALNGGSVKLLLERGPDFVRAISLGAVFFGAFTYIGNGPNFLIKSMVERRRLRMPNFFEYITRYSLPVLLPIFVVVWLILLAVR